MTKKELYFLSVQLSGKVLRNYFGAPDSSFEDMESTPDRKKARKCLFDALAPMLLDKE